MPLLLAVVLAELADGSLDAKAVAVLGVLAACGAALRLPSGGVAGFEPVFFLLVPAGRVFGRGFGFVLGALTLFVSALLTGGVGPWLPFQMFGAAWIGFFAGCLPPARGRAEIGLLAAYAAVASLAYGLVMDLWFWPFVTGTGTGVSYVAGAGLGENLRRFWAFHLATSLGFDLPRAVFTAGFVLVAGRPLLAALRRAARRAAFGAPVGLRPAPAPPTPVAGAGDRPRPARARWRLVSTSTVFVTRALPEPGTAPLLEAGLEVRGGTAERPLTPDELRAGLAEADAVVCMLSDRFDAAVLDAAPRLRVIANYAVGYDNIDVAAARARGVEVTTTPGVLTDATADLAFALLLAAARRVVEGDRLVRAGWQGWGPAEMLGQAVAGRTLGIVGMGSIGQAVARRARGFGMPVLYHNRRRVSAELEAELGARYVSLDEMWEACDFVSLHAPLNPESHHLVDAAALARMKPTAVLVNTGRGPLVDEAALVEALRARRIAAAGLDVFEREPALAEGLAGLDNVVLTPHVGSATTTARATMVRLCCDNVAAVLAGRPALTPAPG